jgi:hypothetical protein
MELVPMAEFTIVTRSSSSAWIPEMIAAAGPEVTETYIDFFTASQADALHLAQCNLVLCPIVKFGCSRGLVSRHLLGVLQPSVVLQVNCDAGCCAVHRFSTKRNSRIPTLRSEALLPKSLGGRRK